VGVTNRQHQPSTVGVEHGVRRQHRQQIGHQRPYVDRDIVFRLHPPFIPNRQTSRSKRPWSPPYGVFPDARHM
jgi:hypothetical protein